MWLFALFLGVPIIEIALFVTVGSWIGLWGTLAIVLGTGVLGLSVIRGQGLRAVTDIRREAKMLQNPARPLADGVLVALAGVLLVLPGFLTDTLGLLLLLPPLRRLVMAAVSLKMLSMVQTRFHDRSDTIDADYAVLPPDEEPRPSDWTRD